MKDKIRFFLSRTAERLWVKPLIVCLISVFVAFVAQLFDQLALIQDVPDVKTESITMLLKIISASMLVMAVFAVGTMLAAYQSASSSATPRAFTLVVSDDVSQNALSTFIGAFIFSIVSQVALINGYYEKAGKFFLFIITIIVFVIVIMGFIKWVDSIARLGRLSTTIAKVEKATADALNRRAEKPYLGGTKADQRQEGVPVYGHTVGYIQRLDMDLLQETAEREELRVEIAVLPGTFVTLSQPLAFLSGGENMDKEVQNNAIANAFIIDKHRTFDDDPRFGLITLSEIASRALSPAVNDPGTAIEIIGIYVRLFTELPQQTEVSKQAGVDYDRVAVPELAISDLFEDAMNAIARDGAGTVEVVIRLLKALRTFASFNNEDIKNAAIETASIVISHAEQALQTPAEIAKLRAVSQFVRTEG